MGSDWSLVRLGDYCNKIGSGSTPKGGANVYLEEGDICLIRSQNIYNQGFKAEGLVFINEEAADKLKNVIVESGDILLNITGDSVARVCLVKDEYLPARVNQHVLIIRVKPSEFDSRYLRYLLASPKMQTLLLSIAAVGATRNALTKGMIESLEVAKPPIETQKQIADNLESLDKKIELNRQINQTLEDMAQALFKSWFVDFEPVKAKMAAKERWQAMQPVGEFASPACSAAQPEPLPTLEDTMNLAAMQAISGKTAEQLQALKTQNPDQYQQLHQTAQLFPDAMQDSELGEIPEGWSLDVLSDICNFTSDRVSVEGLILENYISTENMLEGKKGVTFASKLPNVPTVPAFSKGQVLVSNIRPYFKKIWLASFDGGRSGDVLAFEAKHKPLTEFLYNVLYQDVFFDYMMQTSKGAKMPRGDKSAVMGFNIVIPNNNLAGEFSSMVSSFYKLADSLKKQNQYLSDARDTLLPKLLSGELEIPIENLA